MAQTRPVDKKVAARKSGKQTKKFVEHQSTALDLAASAAKAQEDTARGKVEKRRQVQARQGGRSDGHKSSDRRTDKLKETKAAIAAQRASAKKEKAKVRRGSRQSKTRLPPVEGPTSGEKINDTKDAAVTRKRVSFA